MVNYIYYMDMKFLSHEFKNVFMKNLCNYLIFCR